MLTSFSGNLGSFLSKARLSGLQLRLSGFQGPFERIFFFRMRPKKEMRRSPPKKKKSSFCVFLKPKCSKNYQIDHSSESHPVIRHSFIFYQLRILRMNLFYDMISTDKQPNLKFRTHNL